MGSGKGKAKRVQSASQNRTHRVNGILGVRGKVATIDGNDLCDVLLNRVQMGEAVTLRFGFSGAGNHEHIFGAVELQGNRLVFQSRGSKKEFYHALKKRDKQRTLLEITPAPIADAVDPATKYDPNDLPETVF